MDSTDPTHLYCIRYPGRVVNTDRAIETLGGINKISQTFAHKARMNITFRPDNIYAKGAYGDSTENSGLLIKVKIRRRRNEVKTESVQVVGKTSHSYKFDNMSDYEIVPLVKTPDAELVYDDILPRIDQTYDEWHQDPKPVPYFIVPQMFTRYDSWLDQKLFKSEKALRIKRTLREIVRIDFSMTEPIPEKPAVEFSRKHVTPEDVEMVRAHFNVQPMWTLSALAHEIPSLSRVKIKYCLPFMAYFFVTGPWRNLWTLYGYDPRKEFESRRLQILDLRLNRRAVFNIKSRYERYKEWKVPTCRNNVVSQLLYDETASARPEEPERYAPVFHPSKFRYLTWTNLLMYKDIHVDQIQEMLDKVPSPQNGAKLNERSGWLPVGFDEKCRELMLNILRVHFQMEMGVLKGEEEDQPSNDEQDMDDDLDEDEEEEN